MKISQKEKIIADYIRERNRKAGLALKAKMPPDYYRIIGAKGKAARWGKKKSEGKSVDNSI